MNSSNFTISIDYADVVTSAVENVDWAKLRLPLTCKLMMESLWNFYEGSACIQYRNNIFFRFEIKVE